MSKKKPAKKPARKVAAAKTAARKKAPARAARALNVSAPAVSDKRTNAATIFLYQVDGNQRVRTSPQLLGAAPGYIEWTVVNLASDEDVEVEIGWPNGGPWGGAPIRFRGHDRKSLANATPGRFKYTVTANGYTEDPEVEFPVT